MSHKKKGRSLVTFPIFNRQVEVEKFKENSLDNSLGEYITNSFSPLVSSSKIGDGNNIEKVTVQKSNSPVNSDCTAGSDLEGLLDLSTKLSGLSSSSSLSWSEDYELEITKKVHFELEKLDKAFQGIGDIPPPHDKDEIDEWKQFFPNLCIFGERTPTNSPESSEASTESESEISTQIVTKTHITTTSNLYTSSIALNQDSVVNKRRTEEQAQNFLNASKNYHTEPLKPRSLEIEKYLKISSFKNPDTKTRKQNSQPELTRQVSKEMPEEESSEYTSLPFITATSLKTQIRKPPKKYPKQIILPPITNNFRSISATPRQTSSKSMFVSLNFEKDSIARRDQIKLKSDLMKLFDFIPISNR